ncbi:MAG: TonB-dependent receptor [Acidobacteriota bacterium]|nr:TonB-dependent receptor [Acidobacteriota bacterium]
MTAAGMVLVAGAMAQSVATADLHGTVKDPNGAVVSNATVTVRDESRAFERTTKTAADGNYQLPLLPPGQYTLTVEAAGFGKTVAKDVGVTVGQQAEFSVTLRVAAATTEVTVTGEAALVETQRTSSSTTIGQQRIDNLPINGRNYINFTLTDSQVTRDVAPSIGAAPTSGLNFGGQRARANLVNVDGADNVDASTNGIRSTVSQEAVQEFQIITNSYAAEYGRASGGVVNIITRSGGNTFHGTAFGFLRNRAFQAVNPFSNVPDPAYTRVQAGFTLSGPIKKDKTFIFFSYEITRRHETGFSDVGRDCLGATSCFGLVTTDVSSKFVLPAGSIVIQATPAQAAVIAALPPGLASQAYSFFVGSSSAIALNGTLVGTGAVGLQLTPFNFGNAFGPQQFSTSCNALSNILCNGLPGDYTPLTTQIGNYPVFEGTSLWSARLDHRFNNNNSAMLRANVSPSTQNGIQVNAQNQPFGQNAFSRTSLQQYRDFTITASDTWLIGNNKINEFRFQYARRGLLYDFNTATPDGSKVAVNIVGFAFFGREPFSFVRRVEKRYQFADNFSWVKGNHSFKFGADIQHIPINATFTVNFGNVYNFSALSATAITPLFAGLPGFSSVQAYGLGIPSTMVQGIGNPNAAFGVTPIGFYAQDSWRIRPNITLNYGVRYDVELAHTTAAANALSTDAYNALGIQKGFGTDTNNIQPRLGIAWDPWKDGKTVFRASAGMFYDNPLLGLTFLGNATDGVGTPQLLLFGGSPCSTVAPPVPALTLNATNVFQGILNQATCLGAAAAGNMGYLPDQQRFDPFFPNSTFINQNYLNPATFQPLLSQPFGFPTGKGFEHAYAEQASVSMEHDFGGNFAFSIAYNFTHGVHLNRPINANPVRGDLLVQNWFNAVNAGLIPVTTSPLSVTSCGVFPTAGGPVNVVPASLVSFFRPSGINPSMAPVFGGPCTAFATGVITAEGLGLGVPVPFSDMVANYSNGSSVYHGLTAQMRKRFSHRYEFLASYTWSHTIDDSTDLQSLLSPQDSFFPFKERASSTFDQRHRLVLSGVFQSGRLSGDGFASKVFSNWTVAPIIEVGSGRPFTILTAEPVNFQFSPNTARPNIVPAGTATNFCGFPAQPSTLSPTGFFQTPCFVNAALSGNITLEALDGNTPRNSARRPYTVFTDFRVARRFHVTERVKLDAMTDMFNLLNRFNVADVSLLCSSTSCNAGRPAASFDPRQFQFALKLSW